MRRFFGVLIGTVLGLAAMGGLWRLDAAIFPWPPIDLANPASLGATIGAMPLTAQAMFAGGWFIAALVGGLIGVRIANWATAGWMIAVLVALAGVYQVLAIPHPLWMQIVAVVTPFVAGLVVSGASSGA